MKKLIISVLVSSLMFAVGTGSVSAQPVEFKVIPVELYTCSYNDRQDSDDLEDWVERWTAWMDSIGNDTYSAWTLTPVYFGPNQEFDVIWMGAATNGVALGEAQDLWLRNPNGLGDRINEIMDCTAHNSFASVNHKAPPQGATPATSILTFSDCTMEEGSSFDRLSAGMAQWAEYQANAGSTAGIWHWFPAYGGGGEEFTFKWLEAYPNMAELGADFERYGNGGGFRPYGQYLGHLIDCDSSRAYFAQSRRYVQLR